MEGSSEAESSHGPGLTVNKREHSERYISDLPKILPIVHVYFPGVKWDITASLSSDDIVDPIAALFGLNNGWGSQQNKSEWAKTAADTRRGQGPILANRGGTVCRWLFWKPSCCT